MQKAYSLIVLALVSSVFLGISPSLANEQQGVNSTQTSQVELTEAEQAWIKAHPTITLGGGISFAPFLMQDNDGKVIGYDADIARLIAERTGLNIRFELGDWAEIQERARKRELDGLSTANVTKDREKDYNASRSLIHLTALVIVKKGNPKGIQSLGNTVGQRAVLQKGNALNDILEEQTKGLEAIYVDSLHDIIRAVVSEKADFAIFEESAFYIAHQIGLENMIEAPFTIGEGMDFHFLLRNDWPLLQSIINKGLNSISLREKLEIRRRWLFFPSVEMDKECIPLTDKEKAWIKTHPEIRLGVDLSWHPTEYVDKQGQHQGIVSDYVRILNKRLGINMKLLPNMSWKELMEAMPQRGVDAFSAVVKTPEREKYLTYTDPYLHIDWVIVRPVKSPEISSLADLDGRILAVVEGYAIQSTLKKQYPGIQLLPRATTLDVLESVIEGKAEVAVIERYTATIIIHSYRMHSLAIDSHVFQGGKPLSLAVRNDWPELVQILNKGIASISQEERERIEQKWMAVPIHIGYSKKDLLRIVLSVIAVMGLFLTAFMIWNHRLKKEIDTRTNVEEALKESEERFRMIFENTPVLINSFDESGQCALWNKQCRTTFGWTIDEINTHNDALALFYPDPSVRDEVLRTLTTEPDGTFREWHPLTKDGRRLTTMWANFRLPNGQVFSIGHDITERKLAEENVLSLSRFPSENPNPVLRLGKDGEVLYANEAAEEVLKDWNTSINERAPEKWQKVIEEALNTEKYMLEEYTTTGDRIWSFGISPVAASGYVNLYASDITERRQAVEKTVQLLADATQSRRTLLSVVEDQKRVQEELRTTRDRLDFTLTRSHIGAWDIDLVDYSSYRTLGHDQIFGYETPLKDWTYEMFLEHVLPEDRLQVDQKFQAAATTQSDLNNECRIRRRNDGEVRWIWIAGSPSQNAEGKTLRMSGIVQDVTERKLAEEKVRTLNEELEQRVKDRTVELEAVNRELEAFSYSVSHDLKAPLRSVDGFAQMLEEDYGDRLDEEGRRLLQVVRDSARDMGRLITDLLAFSRLSRTDLRMRKLKLNDLVEDARRQVEADAAGRNIRWDIGELPSVYGDEATLREVLINLFANAVKYTRPQPETIIGISGRVEENEIVCAVTDNGVGFDMAYKDKLFSVFQRLHTAEEFEGTGIGLALVQRIIQRHGGRVWAEGKVDEGATFYFTLPRDVLSESETETGIGGR